MSAEEAKLAKAPAQPSGTRGPSASTLKIRGDWKDAVKQSFQKKKPKRGWPK